MFAADRDLLVLEPNLFRDVVWMSQRLTRGTATLAGNTLTCTAPEVPFDAAALGPGHVVTIGGASYEVTARLSSTQLTVSRIRESPDGPIIPPTPAVNLEMWVVTFRPQLALAHRAVLRAVGISPDSAPISTTGVTPGPLRESDILNPRALTNLEAMSALALAYSAAGVGLNADHPLNRRAREYRWSAGEERHRVVVELDTDGDGRPDLLRALNASEMSRG